MRRTWILEAFLLTVGSLCLGWFVWNTTASEVDELWSNYELSASVRGEKPTVKGYVEQLVKPAPAAQAQPQEKTRTQTRAKAGETLGRIEIPRLRLSAIVREGVDDKTLSRAAGHVPQTALPGDTGNVGIAAHRDTHFRALRNVKIGDTVRMITPGGVHEYRVESTRIVLPQNVEVLDPTPEPSMTLVTCYPFNYVGSAPKRFIVHAKKIEPAGTVEGGL